MKIKTITSILIANRGEIASRIIRTCHLMGIRSIAVYSEADRKSPYVQEADLAIFIGEAPASESYLDMEKIIGAAKSGKADAIHPGYGFLSENSLFAKKCHDEGILFIGPNPNAIEQMGSKSLAKKIMAGHDVPVIPGYQGADQSAEKFETEAAQIGYPVLLKAAAGGGGKGMRIVNKSSELPSALEAAKRESKKSFGSDELIIEKYFPSARHIEFQIMGDQHGNVIHLNERECTIQRRYQKVIEESPSPVMTEELRSIMGGAAIRAAKALNYDNAGTVEFIYINELEYYFLEVNTRLQVEHPVTEMITGLDLVKMQIESAEAYPLQLSQSDIGVNGYAIECRLYAEDPSNNYLPGSGNVEYWSTPEMDSVRFECAIKSTTEISIHYDPMIAKIIAHGRDRAEGQRKLLRALCQTYCMGLQTNQDFLISILQNEDFRAGNYDTHFLSNKFEYLQSTDNTRLLNYAIASLIYVWEEEAQNRKQLKNLPSGWRNTKQKRSLETFLYNDKKIKLSISYDGKSYHFESDSQKVSALLLEREKFDMFLEIGAETQRFTVFTPDGKKYFVQDKTSGPVELLLEDRYPVKEIEKVAGACLSPMPSEIIKIIVASGTVVKKGDALLQISSMKMETTIYAEENGKVSEIYVTEGEHVKAGKLLLQVEPVNNESQEK